MSSHFRPLAAQIDLPAMEHSILKMWADQSIFERSLAAREGRSPWTFYEGPPTANGMPGTHHIEA
ncbi:MAG: class I tRNA ligase family protein, partial [Candidatus Planktophila sp.]